MFQRLESANLNFLSRRVATSSVQDKKLEKKMKVGFHQNYDTPQKPYEPI
jgi:hypothetical protein